MTEIHNQNKSCCASKQSDCADKNETSNTHTHDDDHGHHTPSSKKKTDLIFTVSLLIIASGISVHLLFPSAPEWIHKFGHASTSILSDMWWGVALGIFIIGLMAKMPKEYFIALMGNGSKFSGLLRAVFGGLLLDLCCHGVLLVAAKLYERGVGLPQVITFLVASPWNSVSLTLVLASLIGIKWTIAYIAGSVVIALLTGVIFQILIKAGIIPDNPNKLDIPEDYKLGAQTFRHIKSIKLSPTGLRDVAFSGWKDGKMIVKWLLFGTVIAASSRTFIPHEIFSGWFGPTIIGLALTVVVATVIEICSEGSAPLASEFVTQANAPGNGFAFLMAGVATDYTEILVVRQFTGSWKIALLLPAITVPQVVFLAYIMNMATLP